MSYEETCITVDTYCLPGTIHCLGYEDYCISREECCERHSKVYCPDSKNHPWVGYLDFDYDVGVYKDGSES